MGKSNTLPSSLFKLTIKEPYDNFCVILSVVYNERFIDVFIWEYISWKNSVGPVNQTGNEKVYMLFFFPPPKKIWNKNFASCFVLIITLLQILLSVYDMAGMFFGLYMDYFV